MTFVRRSSPLAELVSLRQAMDRLFEESYVRPRSWATGGFDGYKDLAAGETTRQTTQAGV